MVREGRSRYLSIAVLVIVSILLIPLSGFRLAPDNLYPDGGLPLHTGPRIAAGPATEGALQKQRPLERPDPLTPNDASFIFSDGFLPDQSIPSQSRPAVVALQPAQGEPTPTPATGVRFFGGARAATPTPETSPPPIPDEQLSLIITDVVMTKALDPGQKPLEPTGVFTPTETFYCSVAVSELPDGSVVTAKWYWEDQFIDEYALTLKQGGSGYLGFDLTPSESVWPLGDYRVEIELNGTLARRADFAVVPPADAIPSRIRSAVLTREVDEDYRPIDPTSVFGVDETVHCAVNADLGIGSRVVAKWYYEGELVEDFVTSITVAENQNNAYIDFYLEPEGGLQPGMYTVEVLLDGALARAIDFHVRTGAEPLPTEPPLEITFVTPTPTTSAEAIPPVETIVVTVEPKQTPPTPTEPTIGPIVFSAEVDENYEPLNPGTDFPLGTKVIYATFDYSGFPAGALFEQVWYLDGSTTGEASFPWEEAPSGQYQGSLSNDAGLVAGNYTLGIFLDGLLLGSGDFTIGTSAVGPPQGAEPPSAPPAVTEPPSLPPPPTQESGTPPALEPPIGAPEPAIGPIAFSPTAPEGAQPVVPVMLFPATTTAVYATFEFEGFSQGDLFEQIWYLDGQELVRERVAWSEPASSGRYHCSLSDEAGLPPGEYALEIQLNAQPLGMGHFSIARPVPKTPTPEPVARARIVYTVADGSVHNLWTMNLDGSGQQFLTTHASDPSWSPDGTSIVFYGWDGHPRGSSGVYQMNADGSNVRQIWNQGTAEYLDWAMSGRYVAMTTTASGNKRLVVYDGAEGVWRDIGPGEQPSFSPDGNRIVARSCIGSDCGLFLMGRDGSNKVRLTLSADDAMPSWSPTGDRIVYASQRDGNWDIWVTGLDGGSPVRLTQDPGIDAMPVWFPDGKGIVYRSTRGGVWNIRVMNADGTNDRQVIEAPASADWGRDRLDTVGY